MQRKIEEIQSECTIMDDPDKLFGVLNSPLLYGSVIKLFKESIVIITQSSVQAELLKEHSQRIKEYFNKPGLDFLIKDPMENKENERNAPVKIAKSKGELNGYIIQDYIDTPYIIGTSNELAYAMKNRIIKNGGVMYCFGETGTGKSHLLHQMAHEALLDKQNVFMRSGNDFVEYIKSEYYNNPKEISKYDFIIIDDFQYLNKKELTFIHDPLFEILNQQINMNKKMVFSSDNTPYISSTYYHDRIISRLMSGYVCKIDLPDSKMKEQYVDYYTKKNNIDAPDEIKAFVVDMAKSLRVVKAILGYCQVLYEQKQLNMDKLIEITQKIYGNPLKIKKNKEEEFVHQLFTLLREYFGISEEETHRTGARKPRIIALLDSVLYHVMKDIIKDKKALRKLLNIQINAEIYYKKKGQEAYEKLNDNVKKQIADIISAYKKQNH